MILDKKDSACKISELKAILCLLLIKSYCCSSVTKLCLTLCDHMDCTTPGFPVLHYLLELLKLLSTESVMPSNHLILYHRLLLPSVFLSIRIFSSESTLSIRWPKYWRFCFSISPSNEYSGLISFRIDWFDLLTVLLSHPYMTTGKIIALTSFDLHWPYPNKKRARAPSQAQPKPNPKCQGHL